MYFLTEGLAEVLIKREDKRISIILKKGSYFGEIALITNSLRTSDVRAIDFCVVEIFKKEDFDNLKKEFPSKNINISYEELFYRCYKKIKCWFKTL